MPDEQKSQLGNAPLSRRLVIVVRLILIFSLLSSSATFAQEGLASVRQVRAIETDDLGMPNPAGLASSPAANAFHEVRVAASSDDAEEAASGGMSVTSSDLELVFDGSNQTVGMRFNGVDIPQGAGIVNAYVQFQVDEPNSGATSLVIEGEDVDSAGTFTSSKWDISSRPRTTAAVSWSPVPWTTVGQAGFDQRTPNIASVIQEIVNRAGWSSGNSLVIIITGSGERTAESYNGDSAGAPLLHVEYSTGPINQPPTATISAPADGATFAEGDSITFNGSGSDAEDGDVTASLVWVSSLDGEIGTGASFSKSDLPVSVHTITATATDSGGLTGSAQIAITVTSPSGNLPPVVSAGPDQIIGLFDVAILDGTVTDDGLPDPPGAVTTTWSQLSGPGTVAFADAAAEDTTASFSAAGVYVLELTADDAELTASDQTTVTVNPASVIRVPEDQPTIQRGIDAAQDDDLVLVSPGTYNENLTISGKTITLASLYYTTNDISFRDQTIIDGSGEIVINVNASVGPETKIIGFTIQNGDDGINASAKLHVLDNRIIGNGDGVDYEAGGGICRNNVFENNIDDALDLDGPTEVAIENNTISNSGNDGIEIRLHEYSGPTLNIIVRGNSISGSGEDGIQLVDYPDLSDRFFLIERNLIEANTMAGLGLMDNGDSVEDFRAASIPERIHLFNNTFIGNDHGLTGGDNLIALNNLFVDSIHIGVKGLDSESIAAYNLFWNNGTDHESSNVDLDTALFADPLLDAEHHLLPGSPAIDAGTAHFEWQGETVLDLPGSAYNGAAPDLGRFESDFEPGNQPPAVTITSPGDGATFNQGDMITFTGTAGDAEDGDVTASLVWASSLDGQIGTGGSFSQSDLSVGVHTIIATATDSGGLTGSDEITITVNAVNTPPTATISAPADGATFDQGETITFSGSASDAEDGDVTASLVWVSSIDSEIGTGGSFSRHDLSVGVHTITAAATDSGGLTGSDEITVNVVNTPPTVTISAPADGATFGRGETITFTGTAHDTGDGHPGGPQAVTFLSAGINHVIRYNEIYSDENHYFKDGLGGWYNDSYVGFPHADSDIYGNTISHCWDDGIEAEGGNRNVRIWGNYIDKTYVKIAIASTSVGPIYIWRNILNIAEYSPGGYHGPFIKAGGVVKQGNLYADGQIYVFHNTILQPFNHGCDQGIGSAGGFMTHLVSRNNILHVPTDTNNSIRDPATYPDPDYNDFDYDLYNGEIICNNQKIAPSDPTQEEHGIHAWPIYRSGNGEGEFYLDPSSPGYDDGVVLPNFNDDYTGVGPDMGAHEDGTPAMEFGVDAYLTPPSATHTPDLSPLVQEIVNPGLLSSTPVSPTFVPTFHSIGIYWSPSGGSASNACELRYRVVGTTEWRQGLPLWFDSRNSEYRGSIVHLQPATTYDIELSLPSTGTTVEDTATTWSENFPIAQVIELPAVSSQTLQITQSGTPDGYILYTSPAGITSTIDVDDNYDHNIEVNASYVIIRGLTLKGASRHGIRIYPPSHDVVVERCDISGWGRMDVDGWGVDRDSAIHVYESDSRNPTDITVNRIIIQRNKLHHPRSDSNSWAEADVTASLVWVSSIDGEIGTGGSFSRSDLSVGVHTITATATDSGGLTGSDQITITVNAPPTATISAPADGAAFNEGDSISFTGSASDAEDGDVTASLVWVSSLDGQIGTGGFFSRSDLSAGVHLITATATDSGGLTGSDEVTITVNGVNTPPTATISAPADGATFDQDDSVTFSGSASDAEDGDVTASLVWVSSMDDQIGTGGSFSRSDLSVGVHLITATATDSGGLTGSDEITITVNGVNTPPTATISAPADGATFDEGEGISFSGSASDAEDGDVTGSLVWVSSLDGQIGTGGSFSRSDLSVGVHAITATATDSGGLTGSDDITITVNAVNTPPTATISAPADGATFDEGEAITFSGSASDAEDGDVTASLVWVSSIDGEIGTGGSFSRDDLSVGVHLITATATDSGGLTGSDEITITVNAVNTPPTATISAPADGATFDEGETITFTGSASDAEDGDVTASLVWVSSIDGQIGTGGSFSRSDLSVGVHTITATATDSGGLTGSDEVIITVSAVNTPPTATISAPADGATFAEGDSITFSGSASDAEDGDVTASLVWVSSLDGEIGTGGSFSRSDLSVGVHTITATATDSGGLTGSDEITITVNALNTPPTATISAPADGATFNQGETISFSGSASDAEDGDVTASLVWVSSIDGVIGTGGSFSRSDLSVGVHTITATATDSGGLTGWDEVTITVVLSLNPSGDAMVNSKTPTSNYGSSTSLELRGHRKETINSYLKFVITGVNGTVQSAKLRLYATRKSSFGGSIYVTSNNYLDTTTPWTEDGLTWGNAPGLEGTPLSTVEGVTGDTWVEFDVTAAIEGNGVYSFGLGSNSLARTSYNSKEAAENQPVLVIEIASGP